MGGGEGRPNGRNRLIFGDMRLWLCRYPGVSEMALAGLGEIFALAVRAGAAMEWESGEVAMERRRKIGGFLRDGGWLVVPSGSDHAVDHLGGPGLSGELLWHHARGRKVAAVCVGNFALAASGLLRGRSATTHWSMADEFRRCFPAEDLALERILIDHGDVVSAGGYTAFLDLGLHLVSIAAGRGTALRVSRVLQVDPQRRTQLPWIQPRTSPSLADPGLDRLVARVEGDLAAAWDAEAMARVAGVGVRTLERQFRSGLGSSPRRWLQDQRLERARALLEAGATLGEACEGVGWQDVASFSRLFKERTGTTPAGYRRWVRG